MKNLAADKIDDSLLKILCLGRLPIFIQRLLLASASNFEGLINTAAKIAEVSGFIPLVNSIGNISTDCSKAEDISLFSSIEKFGFNKIIANEP